MQENKSIEERRQAAACFQRETLLELQDVLHDNLRLVHRAYLEDLESSRAGTEWSKALLSEEVSELLRLSLRRAGILRERVANDEIRHRVKSLTELTSRANLAQSEAQAEAILHQCAHEANSVLEAIGTLLRSYY